MKSITVRDCEVVYKRRRVEVTSAKMVSSEAVYKLMGPFVDRAHESMWVLMLDARQKVQAIHECARGSNNSVSLGISTLFRAAVITNAAAIIAVHNHPSGDPNPSHEDLAFTARVTEAGKLLDVPLLDHIIIAESGYYSMLDSGTLKPPSLTLK